MGPVFDQILGIPVHPLVVHAVVVFGPLAALTAIAYAVAPRLRLPLRWWLAGFSVVAGLSALVAGESGEALQRRLRDAGLGGTAMQLVDEHAEAGDVLKTGALLFMVLAVVAVFYLLPAKGGGTPQALRRATAVVLVLASLFLLYQSVVTGHSGAVAVWKQ